MQRINLTLIFLMASGIIFGQKNAVLIKEKGFLFISAYNYRHDWDGSHMRPLGFHDFFFPGQKFEIATQLDSTVFVEGIRVDSIPQRFYVKKKAFKILGLDTSRCYNYDSFYIIPVQIAYREIEEYEPLVCRRPSFFIQQGRTGRIFNYKRKAIEIIKIVLYPDDKRISERI